MLKKIVGILLIIGSTAQAMEGQAAQGYGSKKPYKSTLVRQNFPVPSSPVPLSPLPPSPMLLDLQMPLSPRIPQSPQMPQSPYVTVPSPQIVQQGREQQGEYDHQKWLRFHKKLSAGFDGYKAAINSPSSPTSEGGILQSIDVICDTAPEVIKGLAWQAQRHASAPNNNTPGKLDESWWRIASIVQATKNILSAQSDLLKKGIKEKISKYRGYNKSLLETIDTVQSQLTNISQISLDLKVRVQQSFTESAAQVKKIDEELAKPLPPRKPSPSASTARSREIIDLGDEVPSSKRQKPTPQSQRGSKAETQMPPPSPALPTTPGLGLSQQQTALSPLPIDQENWEQIIQARANCFKDLNNLTDKWRNPSQRQPGSLEEIWELLNELKEIRTTAWSGYEKIVAAPLEQMPALAACLAGDKLKDSTLSPQQRNMIKTQVKRLNPSQYPSMKNDILSRSLSMYMLAGICTVSTALSVEALIEEDARQNNFNVYHANCVKHVWEQLSQVSTHVLELYQNFFKNPIAQNGLEIFRGKFSEDQKFTDEAFYYLKLRNVFVDPIINRFNERKDYQKYLTQENAEVLEGLKTTLANIGNTLQLNAQADKKLQVLAMQYTPLKQVRQASTPSLSMTPATSSYKLPSTPSSTFEEGQQQSFAEFFPSSSLPTEGNSHLGDQIPLMGKGLELNDPLPLFFNGGEQTQVNGFLDLLPSE